MPMPTLGIHHAVRESCHGIRQRILEVVSVGTEVVDSLLIALLARGHVLIEGIPGIGKTLLARTLARCIDCRFHRIQFTNDLLPADIVGSMVWRPGQERFEFVAGPLFANLVLADEINRTSPRSLSCLLEAMENGHVTVEGKTLTLADPFLVLATRNPIEFHGTYPVPEAALDRFLLRVELAYPDPIDERQLYTGEDPEARLAGLAPVLGPQELLELMASVPAVHVSDAVAAYGYEVIRRTREHEAVALGASPRAALAWLKAARARALLQEREYVLPDDLKALAVAVLAHRIVMHGGDAKTLVAEVIAGTPVEL